MAGIKDKVVTVESLSTLHEYNKNTYMTKVDPTGSGVMAFDGNASFSNDVDVGSLTIDSNVQLVFENGSFKILYLKDPVSSLSGVVLLSSEGFILKDSNGIYLTSKESE